MQNGLNYLQHLFNLLKAENDRSVDDRYQSLSSIRESEFQNAAENYTFSFGPGLSKFLYYIKHPISSKLLEAPIDVDFETLNWKTIAKPKNTKDAGQIGRARSAN